MCSEKLSFRETSDFWKTDHPGLGTSLHPRSWVGDVSDGLPSMVGQADFGQTFLFILPENKGFWGPRG